MNCFCIIFLSIFLASFIEASEIERIIYHPESSSGSFRRAPLTGDTRSHNNSFSKKVPDYLLEDVREQSSRETVEEWLKNQDSSIDLEKIIAFAKTRNTDIGSHLKEKISFLKEGHHLASSKDPESIDLSKMIFLMKNQIVFLNETSKTLSKKPSLPSVDYKEKIHPFRREVLRLLDVIDFYKKIYWEQIGCLLNQESSGRQPYYSVLTVPLPDEKKHLSLESYIIEINKLLKVFISQYEDLSHQISNLLGTIMPEEERRKTKLVFCPLLIGIAETLPKNLRIKINKEFRCSVM